MKLNHAIKKIAAIGAGAMLLGVSAAAVAAANATNDLSTYPAPFIANGEFSGNIVLGASAQTIDVLGAVSIATSLQAAAVTKSAVNLPGQQTQTVLQDSVAIKSGSENLHYGQNLNGIKASLTSTDLSMLKTTSFTDTNGNNYDIQFRITPPNAHIAFGDNGNIVSSNSDPTYYVDMSPSNVTWSLNMNFPTAVNLSDLGGQDLSILGQDYTVGQGSETSNAQKTLTLYKSGTKTTVEAGSPQTVTVGGQQVKLSVIGANTNTGTATVSVNGEAKTVTKGNFYSIGGVRVYIDDVFIVDVPTQVASVRFFVGAQKIILEDGQPVRKDDSGTEKDVQGTEVTFSGGGTSDVSQITIAYTPNDQDPTQAPNVNSDTQGLLENSSYVDPVFGQIKWAFTDIVPSPMSASKELIKLYPGADDEYWLKATNKNGQQYAVDLYKILSNGTAVQAYGTSGGERYVFGANYYPKMANGSTSTTHFEVLNKRNRFILSQGTTVNSGSEYSRILEISSVDNNSGNELVRIRDDATGGTTSEFTPSISVLKANLPAGYQDLNGNGATSYKAGTFSYDGYDYGYVVLNKTAIMLVDPASLTGGTVTSLTPITTSNRFVTQNGAELTLPTQYNLGAIGATANFVLTEDTKFNDGNPSAGQSGNLTIGMQYYNTTDNQLRANGVSYSAQWSGLTQLQSNNNLQQAVTVYGTVVQRNKDSTGGDVEMYYPSDQVFYDVFVGPASAGTTTAGTEGAVTTESVNAINVGAAIMDSDAAGLVGSQNLIVVGGPCVNTVAAQLLGNPNDCTTGFTQGSAMIKEFQNSDGTVSLLVAGYSGQDTLLAARVLANYAQYQGQLVGNEVVVSGTTLQNVDISAPVVTQQDNTSTTNTTA